MDIIVNYFVIEGNLFAHKIINKLTSWTSQDGHTKSQIDHIMNMNKMEMLSTGRASNAPCRHRSVESSDHNLVTRSVLATTNDLMLPVSRTQVSEENSTSRSGTNTAHSKRGHYI